jgi:hypothetical protein
MEGKIFSRGIKNDWKKNCKKVHKMTASKVKCMDGISAVGRHRDTSFGQNKELYLLFVDVRKA